MKKIFLVFVLILTSRFIFADTHYAASCSLADVSAAIALADSGDTVVVPSGSATWASQLVITEGIYLIAAGIGSTIITSNYAGGYGSSDSNFIVVYKPASPELNESFRLSGFEFNMATKGCWLKLSNWSYTNIITKIRIDHNKVYGVDGGVPAIYMIYNYGNCYGVADNNDFAGGYFRWLSHDDNWTYIIFDYGTANNFYFEDNTIDIPYNYSIVAYGERSCRYCFRHNTINNSTSPDLPVGFDMHGNQESSGPGTMGAEVYENVLSAGSSTNLQLADQRGGKALFYNNTLNITGSVWTKIREEYDDSLNPPANNVISGQPQHVSDSYYWGNKKNGSTLVDPIIDGTIDYGGDTGVVPRADYTFWYQGATFDGSSGVGVGLLAARPASGLTVGVGYWATDTSTLYRATGATTWETYYTPYTYPHPLRGEGAATNGIMQPGTKIRVGDGAKIIIKEN